jgi:hypothetical protein
MIKILSKDGKIVLQERGISDKNLRKVRYDLLNPYPANVENMVSS